MRLHFRSQPRMFSRKRLLQMRRVGSASSHLTFFVQLRSVHSTLTRTLTRSRRTYTKRHTRLTRPLSPMQLVSTEDTILPAQSVAAAEHPLALGVPLATIGGTMRHPAALCAQRASKPITAYGVMPLIGGALTARRAKASQAIVGAVKSVLLASRAMLGAL
jgi:hypothetical protein